VRSMARLAALPSQRARASTGLGRSPSKPRSSGRSDQSCSNGAGSRAGSDVGDRASSGAASIVGHSPGPVRAYGLLIVEVSAWRLWPLDMREELSRDLTLCL